MSTAKIDPGWAHIARLAQTPDGGGYRIDYVGGGSLSCSDKGMRQLIDQANLMEKFAPALKAFSDVLADRCAVHGLPLWGFDWSINDYAPWGDDPRSPVFMLKGWHGDAFCVAAWARGVLDGSLIAEMGEWRRAAMAKMEAAE